MIDYGLVYALYTTTFTLELTIKLSSLADSSAVDYIIRTRDVSVQCTTLSDRRQYHEFHAQARHVLQQNFHLILGTVASFNGRLPPAEGVQIPRSEREEGSHFTRREYIPGIPQQHGTTRSARRSRARRSMLELQSLPRAKRPAYTVWDTFHQSSDSLFMHIAHATRMKMVLLSSYARRANNKDFPSGVFLDGTEWYSI